MDRAQLEHAIRAACEIAGEPDLIIVGSQSILGAYPDAPPSLLGSEEVDLYPRRTPAKAERIDGSIGEDTPFHDTYGFYVHGVGPETVTLPSGWEQRLIPVCNTNTRQGTGWCLEPHDLAAGKLIIPFREKDHDFVAALLWHGLVMPAILVERLRALPIEDATRRGGLERLTRMTQGVDAARHQGLPAAPSMEHGTWPMHIPPPSTAPPYVLPPRPDPTPRQS